MHRVAKESAGAAHAGAVAGPEQGRVFLRFPTGDDGPELAALRRRSWTRLRAWEPAPAAGVSPYGVEWFRRYLHSHDRQENERLLVCRRSDAAIVGCINLSGIVRGPLQAAYLGYWIGDPYEGSGLMSEALPLALTHAFRTLALHRLEANIRPENTRSIRLVERAGFRREGFSPRFLKIAGRWRDHERWALLADEARAR